MPATITPIEKPFTIPFSSVHLVTERELPHASEIPKILAEAGLGSLTQEVLWVIPYDSRMGVRAIVEVARGGYHNLTITLPAILTPVLLAGTDRFIIAHNHSAGMTKPTSIDIDLTRKVMAAANTCGLFFEDHLILSPRGKDTYSMTDHGIITPAPELIAMARSQEVSG